LTVVLARSIDDLDRSDPAVFREIVAPLFEQAPHFLDRLVASRPFGSTEAMFERALEIALAMPEEEQIELIDAHPRLGAAPNSVSAMSFGEQGYDRSLDEDRAVDAEIARLNDAYEAKFGFRYCVFVAGRSRSELLPGMRAALDRDRNAELRRALIAVVHIARERYRKVERDEGAQRKPETG
jgi:2-oxo-4-hydroxy-4-carboxy--5-ureidoimidazoline (OHCU) decarboxylase